MLFLRLQIQVGQFIFVKFIIRIRTAVDLVVERIIECIIAGTCCQVRGTVVTYDSVRCSQLTERDKFGNCIAQAFGKQPGSTYRRVEIGGISCSVFVDQSRRPVVTSGDIQEVNTLVVHIGKSIDRVDTLSVCIVPYFGGRSFDRVCHVEQAGHTQTVL